MRSGAVATGTAIPTTRGGAPEAAAGAPEAAEEAFFFFAGEACDASAALFGMLVVRVRGVR